MPKKSGSQKRQENKIREEKELKGRQYVTQYFPKKESSAPAAAAVCQPPSPPAPESAPVPPHEEGVFHPMSCIQVSHSQDQQLPMEGGLSVKPKWYFTQKIAEFVCQFFCTDSLPPAERVKIKVTKRKWTELRWTGPFKVVEQTFHALRLASGGDTWYHLSLCTTAEEPDRSPGDVIADIATTSAPQPRRRERFSTYITLFNFYIVYPCVRPIQYAKCFLVFLACFQHNYMCRYIK
ncbi:uncharacterized protein LOC133663533 [Entelurus aequoreus]|uniref:uncharacterized protein LOC133663533 n=1 Tax=Entelurus aequoreus TaxID=161455 RepID=UPI002B1D6221|nr:uncharacterized protein LOC133663533 [Entelurus aequoreus]